MDKYCAETTCIEFCSGLDIETLPTFPWAIEIITVIVTILLSIASYYLFFKLLTSMRHYQAWFLVTISIIMSGGAGICSYYVHMYRYGESYGSFNRWLNSLDNSLAGIAVGSVTMLVFGFMDNAGLFFGSTYLDEVFEHLPYADDANCFAGYGNTYSDFLGAFLGTFCGYIIADLTDKDPDECPLWVNAVSLTLGCLIGIIVPKLIMGDESTQHGINKINAKQALLGNLEEDEVYQIILNQKKAFDFRSERIFRQIDTDDSKTLERAEIKNYLQKALGEVYSDDEFDVVIKTFFHEKNDNYTLDEFKQVYREMAKQMIRDHQSATNN